MKRSQTPVQRKGAAYIVALLAGTIVTISGLSALSIATTQARTNTLEDRHAMSQLMARTTLEYAKSGVAAMLQDGDTRLNLRGDVDFGVTSSYGDGAWRLVEVDGSPLNNEDGPILIEVRGENGETSFRQEALLVPSGETFDVMQMALYAGESLLIRSGSSVTSELPIGASFDVEATAALVDAPVEAGESVIGGVYLSSTASRTTKRLMPADDLFTYYVNLGEEIDIAALPARSSSYWLEELVLSPSENPFGRTNPLGIYFIDCAGARVTLSNVRVVGTLVLLNSVNESYIGPRTLMQPLHPWMPSLLVQGDLGFYGGTLGPSESIAGLNFNPAGTPYKFVSDNDTTDVYLSEVQGLCYVSDTARFYLPSQPIRGKVIAGNGIRVRSGVDVTLFHDPSVEQYPPYGFFVDEGGLALAPSTIEWTLP